MKSEGHVTTQIRRALLGMSFLLFLACSPEPYKVKEFSFPPNSANWKYKGTISFVCRGNPEERNLKTLKIHVKDKQGNTVLDDEMQFNGAKIDARVAWKKAVHFKVVIREKGTRGATDEHNKKLLKRGGRTLSRTNYWYDSTKGKFR